MAIRITREQVQQAAKAHEKALKDNPEYLRYRENADREGNPAPKKRKPKKGGK